MKNSIHLSRLALAALACATVATACTDRDARYRGDDAATRSDATTSGTTLNNVGPAVAPASSDSTAVNETSTDATTSNTTSSNSEYYHQTESQKAEPQARVERDDDWTEEATVVNDDDSISGASTDNEVDNQDDDEFSDEDLDETASSEPMTEDTTISGTSSVSNEDMAKQWKHSALTPFFHEPASRTPIQIGSTTITGKDKNMAIFEPMNKFIDPAARERNLTTRDATRPVAELNFGDYDYSDRNDFKSDMQARLALIDYRIDDLKGTARTSDSSSDYKDQLARVEQEHWNLERQVDSVRNLNSERWDGFRSEFRDKLASLEQDVARLNVALK